jgi:hypothetical protein
METTKEKIKTRILLLVQATLESFHYPYPQAFDLAIDISKAIDNHFEREGNNG